MSHISAPSLGSPEIGGGSASIAHPTFSAAKPMIGLEFADDSPLNRKIVGGYLKAYNRHPDSACTYQYAIAEDGPGAIQLYRDNLIHIALLDFEMPGMNGDETAARIREIAHQRLSGSAPTPTALPLPAPSPTEGRTTPFRCPTPAPSPTLPEGMIDDPSVVRRLIPPSLETAHLPLMFAFSGVSEEARPRVEAACRDAGIVAFISKPQPRVIPIMTQLACEYAPHLFRDWPRSPLLAPPEKGVRPIAEQLLDPTV
jgi:CheY-like chemotaxis protein